jgi:PAS domain S-box-containing protein
MQRFLPWSGASRRALIVAAAALLFAAVFAFRLAHPDASDPVTLLYCVPIALLASEFGLAWGLGAAALSLGLYALWAAGWEAGSATTIDFLTRGVAFSLIGGLSGHLADRLRQIAEESDRYFELSADMLCTAGFDGYFTRLNPAWERTLGWTREELLSRPFIDFVHPDDRERTAAEAARLAESPTETISFRNRYRAADGSYRWLEWSAKTMEGEHLIYATARDITAQKEAEDRLEASESFLDSVLENLPNMVVVKDAEELRFVRFNRAGEELLGRSRDQLIGKNDYDFFPRGQAESFAESDREVLASSEVLDLPEEPIETARGERRIVHTRKVAIRDQDGTPRYLLGISADITERKRAEVEAEAAREEADRANQAKSEFLSRMSHELRTPLNAILGFGQLLELDELEPGQREGVEQILKGGRHLLELINEVLDISRIEAGTMSYSIEPVHLGSVLAEALSLIRPLADEAEVLLAADPSKHDRLYVLADQQRLKQVLLNLLSNAVKYNRAGGEVRVRCDHPSADRVRIAVSDTGVGMSERQLGNLFSPFERLGADRTNIEGTGLGLALSKRLVEAMGGTITADSHRGTGTTLRVELERAEAPEEERPASDRAALLGDGAPGGRRSVLYVEDNLSNMRVVERALERIPRVKLLPAMYGKLGLELARKHRPDLVLLDLHLPDLPGEELLERLKADPVTAGIPVVVVSADATPGQIKRLRAAGAADYLTKPLDVQRLLEIVEAADPALERGQSGTGPAGYGQA